MSGDPTGPGDDGKKIDPPASVADINDPKSIHLNLNTTALSGEPQVFQQESMFRTTTEHNYALKGNARYNTISKYSTSLTPGGEGTVTYNVDIIPHSSPEKIDFADVVHFGVDKKTLENPAEVKATAAFLVKALKSDQNLTVEIEGHASRTGVENEKLKAAHNKELSDARGTVAYAEIKKEAGALGIPAEEFDRRVKITQQSFGDQKDHLIVQTEQEAAENRVAVVRIKNLEVTKSTYHEITINADNARGIHDNQMNGGTFSVSWLDRDDPRMAQDANAVNVGAVGATIKLEGVKDFTKSVPTIRLRNIDDANNVKIVIPVDDLPQDASIIVSHAKGSGLNTIYLAEKDKPLKLIAVLPVVDKSGAPKDIGELKNISIVSGGKEYRNFSGATITQVVEINNRQEALAAVTAADLDGNSKVRGKELEALKKNHPDLFKLVENMGTALGIKYDAGKNITEIDILPKSSPVQQAKSNAAVPVKGG